MRFKRDQDSKLKKALQILIVFALSALIHNVSFANTGVATLKAARVAAWLNTDYCNHFFADQAAKFNKGIDPELGVSLHVGTCTSSRASGGEKALSMPVELKGRQCPITKYTAYQLANFSHSIDETLLAAVGIINFGLNEDQSAYILAIPKCD